MAFTHLNISERLPIPAKHLHFIIDTDMTKCDNVVGLPPEDRCEYVQTTESCMENGKFLHYMRFIYCTLNAQTTTVLVCGFLIMVLLVCIYFMFMGTTADKFFVPVLALIAQYIGLSETVAGVTLLALGNGSPDLITTLALLNDEDELMYSELFGAAMFITTIVAGAIIIVSPFKVYAPHYLRDVLYFLLSALFIDWITATQKSTIDLKEAVTPLVIYFTFIIVVIVDQIMANWSRKTSDFEIEREAITLDIKSKTSLGSEVFTGGGRNEKLFKQFWQSLNPIDMDEWRSDTITSKIITIILAPIVLILNFFLPRIASEEQGTGWSKLLNSLQCFTLPSIIMYALDSGFKMKIIGFPIVGIIALVGFGACVIVFCVSRTDTVPKFYAVFLIMSIAGSVFVIWIFAEETVQLLSCVGLIFNLSMSFLGGTTLAWGNSIGDLISNLALARQGYVKMGFAGCYGGPMFNVQMGVGITMLYKVLDSPNHRVHARKGYLGDNCALFLIITLFASLFAMLLTNFQARRSIGIFLVLLYFVFIVYAIFSEMAVIHAFGTDHM